MTRGTQTRHTLWSLTAPASSGVNSLIFTARDQRHPLGPSHSQLVVAVFSTEGHPSDLVSVDLTVTGASG
jgi:hypothetical protein